MKYFCLNFNLICYVIIHLLLHCWSMATNSETIFSYWEIYWEIFKYLCIKSHETIFLHMTSHLLLPVFCTLETYPKVLKILIVLPSIISSISSWGTPSLFCMIFLNLSSFISPLFVGSRDLKQRYYMFLDICSKASVTLS